MTDHVIILLRSKIKSNEKNWSDKKEEEKREIELFHSGVVAKIDDDHDDREVVK